MVAESTEMYNCYLFYVKNLKWKIMPGRNWSEDESKSKKKDSSSRSATDHLHSLRFREVKPLANSSSTKW